MTITKVSPVQTMAKYGLISCDFVYNSETGIEFTVYAQASEPDVQTTATPLFSYNDDEAVEAIKEICLMVVDDGFPNIHNILEVGGYFCVEDNRIFFEGDVTTLLPGEIAYIG